jgi:hypothetical protein
MPCLARNWYQSFFFSMLCIEVPASGMGNALNQQDELSELCLVNVISNDIRECLPQAFVLGTLITCGHPSGIRSELYKASSRQYTIVSMAVECNT